MPDSTQYPPTETDQQFLQDVVAPPPAAAPAAPAYTPGFNIGERNFDTLLSDLGGEGVQISPSLVQGMFAARPDLFVGIEDPMSLFTSEASGYGNPMASRRYTPTEQLRELLSGMSLQRRGVDGGENLRTKAVYDPQGNLVYATQPFEYDPAADLSGALLQGAALFATPFTGGLSASLGSALGSQALGTIASNALVQGTLGGLSSSAQGGSFGKGFGRGALTGGITGAISPYINQFGEYVSGAVGGGDLGKALSGAVTGAAKSGIGALTTGTSVGDALLAGGLSGGVGAGVNALGGSYLSDLPPSVRNAVTSAISAGVLGRDPSQAAINAFIGSLSMPSRSPEEQALYDAYQSPHGQSSRDQDIYNPYGSAGGADGFTSQWQSVGSDRVFIHDDGSATVLNPGTGETFDMNEVEVQQMVSSGLLNTPQSGYDAAIRGTPATTSTSSGARPPASGSAAPGSASGAGAQGGGSRGGGSDMAALLELIGGLGAAGASGDDSKNAAQIATRSPYGNEIYGMRFGNV